MTGKLLKTKWYIVDLDSKRVLTERIYEGFWKAVDAEQALGQVANFTALRGSHILKQLGKPWILPGDVKPKLRVSDYAHMGVRRIEGVEQ